MKNKLIGLLMVMALSSFNVFAQSKFFTTKGKEIVGPDGKPFLIKGTNLGNWLVPEGYMFKLKGINSPRLINQAFTELIGPDDMRTFWRQFLDTYITEADIHYLKTTGMNSIRIPFNYRLFTTETYMGESDASRGFKYLDRVLGWCKKENLYVILDMHCAPGGQTGDNIDDGYGYPFLFENKGSQELTAKIWKDIAARYKNESIVMGYDLLNEPIAHYFNKDSLNHYLEPVYKDITKAIRTVDKNHLIFLGGAQWDTNFTVFGQPFDSKLVYTFHTYWTAVNRDVIKNYLDFRDKYNVPIYIGETGENTDEWVHDFRVLLEQNNIGWHYWPYKKMDSSRGFRTFDQPAGYDQIIDYTEKPRQTFEDIRKANITDRQKLKAVLFKLLENSTYANSKPNKGYTEALGLSVGQ